MSIYGPSPHLLGVREISLRVRVRALLLLLFKWFLSCIGYCSFLILAGQSLFTDSQRMILLKYFDNYGMTSTHRRNLELMARCATEVGTSIDKVKVHNYDWAIPLWFISKFSLSPGERWFIDSSPLLANDQSFLHWCRSKESSYFATRTPLLHAHYGVQA